MRFGFSADSDGSEPGSDDSASDVYPPAFTARSILGHKQRTHRRKREEEKAWQVYRRGTAEQDLTSEAAALTRHLPRQSAQFPASPVPPSRLSPSPFALPAGTRTPGRRSSHVFTAADEGGSSSGSDAEEEMPRGGRERAVTAVRSSSSHSSSNWPFARAPAGDEWPLYAHLTCYERSLAAAVEHRRIFERIHSSALSSADREAAQATRRSVDELGDLLAGVDLARRQEERNLRQGFETRERERAENFERLIRGLEQRDKDAALALQRRRDAQAAAVAAEARRKAEEAAAKEARRRADEAVAKSKAAEALAMARREQEASVQKAAVQAHPAAEGSKRRENPPPVDDLAGRAEWEKWTALMHKIKVEVLPKVAADDRLRGACRQARRKITPKIGQLTNEAQQIGHVINDLHTILSSASSAGGPLAYTWLLNHLAKAFIKQSETEITAKLSTAYPLARVVVGLLIIGHSELGDVLMARLNKKCFLLSGHLPRRQPDQSDAEYRKVLGHLADQKAEDGVRYSTRLAAIVALWAAIAQTSPIDVVPGLSITPDTAGRIPSHFRPAACWELWGRLLQQPSLSKLMPTPEALAAVMELAGICLARDFGEQWTKLMRITLDEGIRKGKTPWHSDARPSVVRLEALLEAAEGGVPRSAEGRLLPA